MNEHFIKEDLKQYLCITYFSFRFIQLANNDKTGSVFSFLYIISVFKMKKQYDFYGPSYKPKTLNYGHSSTQRQEEQPKLYKSQKLFSNPSNAQHESNPKLTSEQMMNNLNLSFDDLFSKIEALKGGQNYDYTSPVEKQKIQKNDGSLNFSVKFDRSQTKDTVDISKSLRLTTNYERKPERQSPKEVKNKVKQNQEFHNPFLDIVDKKSEPSNDTHQNFQSQKQGNAFINQKQVKSSFGFSKFDSLMGIPTLKASVNFPDDSQDQYTRPATSQSKLDAVVEKLAQKNSRKAIKQSILLDSIPIEAENEKKSFKMQDFQLGKCVGSGKFGDVFICRHKETGFLFALKKIFKSTILQYDMITQFIRELRIHYLLNHPNIIKLYSHFQDEYHIFLLMEYAEGGILMDRLKCGEDQASKYVAQAIDAVEYLHSLHIAHRDIKPENIVLQFGNVIKLCDFGWSSFYSNEMKTTFCGTLDYLSPQMKEKGQYDNSVDIWSIGVLTYELLVGSAPFQKQITNWRKQGSHRSNKWNWNITYPMFLSTISESFMRNLLKEKPQERSTLRFCASHMFIRRYEEPLQQNRYFEEFSKIL